MEILQLKMKQDLLKMSLEYTENLDIDKDEFTNWITHRIDYYIDKEKISFSRDKDSPENNNKSHCSARVWNGGQGEKQCSHNRVNGTHFVKHEKMLNEEGVLRFGDIRDPRPSHDLIKKKNGTIEKLHWIDPNPIQQIQTVLDQQRRKVILSTPKLIVN